MKNDKYISLIHKSISGEINTAEQNALDAWINESKEHSSLSEDIRTAWDLSASFDESVQFNPSNGFSKFQQQIKAEEAPTAQVFRLMPRLMQVAAVFILLLGAWFVFDMNQTNVYTADGDVLYVSLDDGTEVWLNDGSSVEVSKGFNQDNRTLNLKGEGFFDVARNEDVPFLINVNNAQVRVLGTAFNIESSNKGVILEVKEGLVEFSNGEEKTLVKPTEKVILNDNTNLFEKSSVSSSNSYSWIHKELSFQNTPMAQVFEELERYFNVSIYLNSSSNLDCSFTSPSLKDISLSEILKVIATSYSMDYTMVNPKEVKITKFDCK